jgi:protein-S-isoprenylcysteine O-methyltransferase Ste14
MGQLLFLAAAGAWAALEACFHFFRRGKGAIHGSGRTAERLSKSVLLAVLSFAGGQQEAQWSGQPMPEGEPHPGKGEELLWRMSLEERILENAYGEEYRAWARRTRRP